MAWTTIQAAPEDLDEEIDSFQSGVTSIDGFSTAAHGRNQLTATIRYTP